MYISLSELRDYLDLEDTDTYTPAFGADTLTLASVPFRNTLKTGTEVTVASTLADPPAPLVEGTVYYVILGADQVIQLAATSALAAVPTPIVLTDDGTGTHTITREDADTALLTDAISAAQTYIESQTNRTFEAAEDIRYYGRDALSDEDRRLLLVDGDLVTGNTLTNGDFQAGTTYVPAFAADRLTLASTAVWDALIAATPLTVTSTTHDPPAPLVEGTVYYAILLVSPGIQVAATAALALAGTAITLTDNGTGTHTVVPEGTPIPNTEYWLHPRNLGPPYFGIRLKTDSTYSWTFDTDCFVSVNGDWAYSAAVPGDIKEACKVLAAFAYRRKDSQVFEVTAIPGAGVITIPQGIPAGITDVLTYYKRH